MIKLIEDNTEHGYRIYRSEVIVNYQKEMIDRINTAHSILMNRYGRLNNNSTWLYRTYNIFSLLGSSEHFYELYTDLLDVIKLYVPNDSKIWFQSWLNFHQQNQVLDWHTHEWYVHGYISLDPKKTETIFRNYTIKNELGNIYIGPGGREHKVEVLEPFEGRRITLGYDVTNEPKEPNDVISLIPIVK
jgi:hypothetical protein